MAAFYRIGGYYMGLAIIGYGLFALGTIFGLAIMPFFRLCFEVTANKWK